MLFRKALTDSRLSHSTLTEGMMFCNALTEGRLFRGTLTESRLLRDTLHNEVFFCGKLYQLVLCSLGVGNGLEIIGRNEEWDGTTRRHFPAFTAWFLLKLLQEKTER